MLGRFHHVRGVCRAFGPTSGMRIWGQRTLGISNPVSVRYLDRMTNKSHAMQVRPMDSDMMVASQVFGWKEYELPRHIITNLNKLAQQWAREDVVPLIVDGGANVGYSAIYFAETFPTATVVAVEPNPETFEFAKSNTSKHQRIMTICGALWSDNHGVELNLGTAGAWATSTTAARTPQASTPSFTLAELLKKVPKARALILKLDIEGAERPVCEASQQLLRDAPCIIVEPHDYLSGGSGCLVPLFRALCNKEVDTLIQSENIIFINSTYNKKSAPQDELSKP